MKQAAPQSRVGEFDNLRSRLRDIGHHSVGLRLVATAPAVLGGFMVDRFSQAGISPENVAWRVAWATSFALGGYLAIRSPRVYAKNIPALLGVLSALFADRLLVVAGEGATSHLGWNIAFPFTAAVIAPESPRTVVATTLAFAATSFYRTYEWWGSVGQSWSWSFSVLLAGSLALYASLRYVAQKNASEKTFQQEAGRGVQMALSAERKAEMARVSRLKELAALGEATAGIAHEINNPLAIISTNSAYLSDALDDGDIREVRSAAADIRDAVGMINSIIMTVQSSARGIPGHERIADVRTVADDALRMVRYRFGALVPVDVRITIDAYLAEISAMRLLQVLTNLLVNAYDALLEDDVGGTILVHGEHQGDDVVIMIDDNGKGIPQPIREKVFEPFFTTKPEGEGTGLGLALCREYVRRVGGEISAAQAPDGGSRIIVRLPAVSETV